jgi:hypothetical protein
MPFPLAPNERLAGTPDQRRALHTHLHAIRASARPHQMHPKLSLTYG